MPAILTNAHRRSACGVPSPKPEFVNLRHTGKPRAPERYQWPVNLRVAQFVEGGVFRKSRPGKYRRRPGAGIRAREAWVSPMERFQGEPLFRRQREGRAQ